MFLGDDYMKIKQTRLTRKSTLKDYEDYKKDLGEYGSVAMDENQWYLENEYIIERKSIKLKSDPIVKLGKLEDLMDKYNISSIDELEIKLLKGEE